MIFIDFGPLTLLFQDKMGGLEVFNHTCKAWIKVAPEEGAILLNLGDIMEILTNGRLPAAWHRVTVPNEEIVKKRARQSIAFFVHLDHEATVDPLDHVPYNDEVHPANLGKVYKPTNSYEHVYKRVTEIREGYTYVK